MKKYLSVLCLCLLSFAARAGECDFIRYNKCHSCDDLMSYLVGSREACVKLCPNRETSSYGTGSMVTAFNCYLAKCPDGYPYQDNYGGCFTSEQAADEYFRNSSRFDDEDVLKSGFPTAPEAVDGKCPPDRPLLYSGKCFSCDERDDLTISEEECNKCPNRKYAYYPHWRKEACYIPCPPDKPLMRWDGKCFSCDEPKTIELPTHCNLEEDCEDWCPNRTILYAMGGNVPSVIKCPPDKPLMDREGICFSCDAPFDIGLEDNTRLCEQVCPNNRHLEDVYCVLNQAENNE